MNIQKGEYTDIDNIVKLWGKLSDYHKVFRDYMSPSKDWNSKIKELFREDINDDNKLLLVCKENNEVVGFIRAEIKDGGGVFEDVQLGYISDIYIEEKFRGTGISEDMIKEVILWFKDKGIYNLRLNVNSQNMAAIKLYKKLGFEEVNKTMSLDF